MKSACAVLAPLFFVLASLSHAESSSPKAGFFLPDSVDEMTLRYRTVKDLIVLPVRLNDSIEVNLILDTGCRNLILFGKRFAKMFKLNSGKPVEFSGLGTGEPVTGALSLGNRVSIQKVVGEQIPIVIVKSNKLFGYYHNVDGVIGYEIFLMFEIELNPKEKSITFRQAFKSSPPDGFSQVPLRVVDARPVMQSELFIEGQARSVELMIDTGSSLGLLLKTTDLDEFSHFNYEKVLGIGLNGPVPGYETISQKLVLQGIQINKVPTGIVSSPWHNNASIGMDILKDYIVVVNYCKSYACFKRYDS